MIKKTTKTIKTAKVIKTKQPVVEELKTVSTFSYKIPSLIILVLSLGIVAYYFKGFVIAATVNGQPVSRLSIVKTLEKQYGSQALDQVVTDMLIKSEAKKQNIVIDPSVIDEEIATISARLESSGQDLEQLLAMQGLTEKDIRDQIYIQRVAEKLAGSDNVSVTDEEVLEFVKTNPHLFDETDTVITKNQKAKDQLTQRKTQELVSAWYEQLHQSAKINYFVSY